MIEDRPTLIYYVQTVLNTFKRDIEQGFVTRDKEYAITLLEKAMECQNDIWNAAIEEAANLINDELGGDEEENYYWLERKVRGLKK